MKKIFFFAVSVSLSSQLFAGGYRVALQGQNAAGMAHTGVAITESAEVIFFNPAGMARLKSNNNLSTGVTLVNTVSKYQNSITNTSAETDNPIGTPLYLYYSRKTFKNISLGFGLYTPYGNTVEWPKDWAGSHLVNKISLKTVYFQPTISYKIDDKFSIGFGPVLVNGKVEFNRNLGTSPDLNGNRTNVTIKASGLYGWGYNVGLLAKPIKSLTIGLSFRSKVELSARDEEADFRNIPASLQGTLPDTKFDADLVLPGELTVGLAYNLNADLLFAFDINRTFWAVYEDLNVKFQNGAGKSLNPRNYNDANIYRFGVQHLTTHRLTLRGGVYYDKSPIGSGFVTPETARNDSIGFTAGASYQVTKRMGVDISFLYLLFNEFNGSYDHFDQSGRIISFGGEYKSTASSVGFGVKYQY